MVTLILFFQNCGVEQPRVENGSYSAASMTPTSHKNLPNTTQCMSCHEDARPIGPTTLHDFNHKDTQWSGADCKSCHSDSATWGISWRGGQFAHSPRPATCIACHNNQMPTSPISIDNNPATTYLHTAGVECATCHDQTSSYDVIANWRPATSQPSGNVGSRTFSIDSVNVTFNGDTMIRSAPAAKSLPLEIEHGHTLVGNMACATCHTGTNGVFAGAYFHKNIAANPGDCISCHINARPSGAVGAKKFMRHEAVSWTASAIGSVSRGSTPIVPTECITCHLTAPSMPQAGQTPPSNSHPFSGANFHSNTVSSGLTSCLDCHAHSRPSGSSTFTNPAWKNQTNSGAPPFTTFDLTRHAPKVDCATCHSAPSVASSTAASWANGDFNHTSAAVNCLNCHTASGITSINHSGFTSNCVSCHTGATAKFPNPVISDWKVNVTGGQVPAGVVGTKVITTATTCQGVAGQLPKCSPTAANVVAKGYDHAINTKAVSCSNCHGSATPSSANGKFHTPPAGLAAASWSAPASGDVTNCARCHDPSTLPQNIVSIRNLGMIGSQVQVSPFAGVAHGFGLVTSQSCSSCHTAPGPTAASSWTSATKIHSKFTPGQFTSCTECHYKRMPSGTLPRKNQVTYKGTSVPQNFTHVNLNSLPTVASQQCATCHTNAGGPWTAAGKVSYHNRITVSRNCNLCHVAPGGTVTSSTTGASFNHSQVSNLGDCVACHQASVTRVAGRIPTASDWDGGAAAPATYTIPSHTSSGITIPGYTATHTTNTSCTSCHGTGDYGVITDFDHQGLPAGANTCITCHLGSKSDVSAYIASTAPITTKTLGDRHHPTSIFNGGKSTSCVGCHTVTKGASTFNTVNGIVYPTAARNGYTSVGCGSVSSSTFSCHESSQRIMTVPSTTGTSGKWK